MAYSTQTGMDFWFEFDDSFLWNPSQQAIDALTRTYDFGNGFPELDRPVDLLRTSVGTATHPASFIAGCSPNKQGFIDLARLQFKIIDKHLANESDIQSAFEDFAQGVLFDDRRIDGAKVHKMDGDPEDWVGYHRWHAFVRAVQLFGETPDRWHHLNRCMGLAWGIQTEARPKDDDRTNPRLLNARLNELRSTWMTLPVDVLDWAFTSHRFHAPTTAEIAAKMTPTAPTGYALVQKILEDATPSGNPRHRQAGVNQGRFWTKPYAEFLGLSVYNHGLIAPAGPNRGDRSALVQVLRGTLVGVPRMPRAPLPPISDANIQVISDWIDAGMPES